MPEKQIPSTNRIRETLGRLYEHQPPHFREYIRRYQQDPTSRVFAPLAESYRRLGRLDEAIDICLEGLKHHPDFLGGRVALARCFIDKKKFVRAKEELETVVGIAPENLLAQRLLGDCFFNLQEMEQSLKCYKIALVLSPSDVGLQDKVHRMEMQMSRGDFEPSVPDRQSELAVVLESKTALSAQRLENTSTASDRGVLTEALLAEVENMIVEGQSNSETLVETPVSAGFDVENDEEILLNQTEEDDLRRAKVDAILGFDEENGDSFKTEDVAKVFADEVTSNAEITTQTLGELYFSQGQYEKALKIFEKIYKLRPSMDLASKIQSCRAHMGVDSVSLRRQQKIDALSAILKKNRNNR